MGAEHPFAGRIRLLREPLPDRRARQRGHRSRPRRGRSGYGGSIPDHVLVVGGFPCQDFSVAKTLNQAVGIQGKKGVLWWQIHRLLSLKRPPYLFLENVDRLLKSPTRQRGRDFAVMLATLNDLGYDVEWRVVNAADYGFPQKRRRVFIVGRLTDDPPRDPNDVLHHGTIARALPVREGPRLSATEAFRIEGDPAEVSEAFGARKGPTSFRSAGYVSHRRVWTVDLVPEWDGPFMTLGDILEPTDAVPEFILHRRRRPAHLVVPERRETRAASAQGDRDAVRLRRGPDPLPRPDRQPGPDDPHGRGRTDTLTVQAHHPDRRRPPAAPDPARARAAERIPRRLDRDRHGGGPTRVHDGQLPRRRARRADRPRAHRRGRAIEGLTVPRVVVYNQLVR